MDDLKICLIRPPSTFTKGNVSNCPGIPPVGLAYIAGALSYEKIDYQIIDAVGNNICDVVYDKKSKKYIRGSNLYDVVNAVEKSTNVIGISTMFSCDWSHNQELIVMLRESFPSALIIVGGEHATGCAENILRNCNQVDVCVLGEGEETFLEIIKHHKDNMGLNDVAGIYFRSKEKQIIKNTRRKRLKNLDSYLLNWNKFPINNYLNIKAANNTVTLRAMPIVATRGCPHQCTFCTSPSMWGREYVMRRPESIIKEIKHLIKEYNIEHVDFTDTSGTINKNWLNLLCETLIEQKLPISWHFASGVRSESLSEPFLKKLKLSNYLKVIYAPETGSDSTQKRIKKDLDLKQIIDSIKSCKKIGLPIKIQLIMGLPGQGLREIISTILFTLKLSFWGINDIVVYSFVNYPGSEIAKQTENNSTINNDTKNDLSIIFNPLGSGSMRQKIISLTATGIMIVSFLVSIIFHPDLILDLFRRIIKHKPISVLEMFLYKIIHPNKKNISKISNE